MSQSDFEVARDAKLALVRYLLAVATREVDHKMPGAELWRAMLAEIQMNLVKDKWPNYKAGANAQEAIALNHDLGK